MILGRPQVELAESVQILAAEAVDANTPFQVPGPVDPSTGTPQIDNDRPAGLRPRTSPTSFATSPSKDNSPTTDPKPPNSGYPRCVVDTEPGRTSDSCPFGARISEPQGLMIGSPAASGASGPPRCGGKLKEQITGHRVPPQERGRKDCGPMVAAGRYGTAGG
jgi:hypothetical protein